MIHSGPEERLENKTISVSLPMSVSVSVSVVSLSIRGRWRLQGVSADETRLKLLTRVSFSKTLDKSYLVQTVNHFFIWRDSRGDLGAPRPYEARKGVYHRAIGLPSYRPNGIMVSRSITNSTKDGSGSIGRNDQVFRGSSAKNVNFRFTLPRAAIRGLQSDRSTQSSLLFTK